MEGATRFPAETGRGAGEGGQRAFSGSLICTGARRIPAKLVQIKTIEQDDLHHL